MEREEGAEERREAVGAGRCNRREGGRRRWRWMREGVDDAGGEELCGGAGGGSRAAMLEEGVGRRR
jgi:hypothetical protein